MNDPRTLLDAHLRGRYQLVEELGSGGTGTVYLARDLKHGRAVALKVLHSSIAQSLTSRRFLDEVRITAGLQHPNILPLLDSGSADGLPYYVTPYVEGETLRERILTRGRLPRDEALRIAGEVTGALGHAHGRGIIHRDVKPENILLSGGHAMVADFGVAVAVERAADEEGGTGPSVAAGTPAYMSPEQMEGLAGLDGRSDLYSLGCVLYEMLVGRPPFTATTAEELLRAHRESTRPAPPRNLVGTDVARILDRLLARDPADRFVDAVELRSAIDDARRRVPSEGGQDSAGPAEAAQAGVAGAGSPTRRWLIAGALGVGVAGAAAMVVMTPWRGGLDRDVPGTITAGANAPGLPVPSVAVLAFRDVGESGAGGGYFAAGITEEITARLARLPGLKVISRTSVEAVRGSALTVPQVGRQLGVDNILEGSVRRDGSRVRVRATLVDARSERAIWSQNFDRELDDIFAVQDQIAREVTLALAAAVTDDRAPPPAEATTAAIGAYDAYLRGLYALRSRTGEGLLEAVRMFERATELDSTFAAAHAGAAIAITLSGSYGYESSPALERALVDADAHARRAVALAPDLAEAQAAVARVLMVARGDAEGALAGFDRAVALRPGSADLHAWRGAALSRAGRPSAAVTAARRAVELDPLAPGVRVGLANRALGARDYALALEEARRASLLEPGLRDARLHEALALLLSGRADECLTVDLTGLEVARAMCSHSIGQVEVAQAIADSVGAAVQADPSPAGVSLMVTLHAWMGNRAAAIDWLDRATTPVGVPGGAWYDSGLFDEMRSDPLFDRRVDERRRELVVRELGGSPDGA